jgi:phytoene dehydrogenase-like protein
MDYPKGGVKSIVETLVGSIEASPGCSVQCKAEVKRFVRDSSGRIIGVEVKNGDFLRAKHGVVSNAGTWATQELLQNSDDDATKSRKSNKAEAKWRVDQSTTPACNSFMHLHVGFSTAGLSAEKLAALQCHYMILSDWDKGVEAEDNAVLVSIPSTHDPSLAPEGHMVMNRY